VPELRADLQPDPRRTGQRDGRAGPRGLPARDPARPGRLRLGDRDHDLGGPGCARPRRAVVRRAPRPRRRPRMNRGERLLIYAVLAIAVAFAVGPVVGVILVALQAHASVGGSITSVTDLTLDNLGR